MKQYIAKEGESLDMICYKFYGTLETEIYGEFLRQNAELLHKFRLDGGDEVNLPTITQTTKKEIKYLWQ